MHIVKLLIDKSINLPDTLISKKDLNEMQGAMDKPLANMIADQEYSISFCANWRFNWLRLKWRLAYNAGESST